MTARTAAVLLGAAVALARGAAVAASPSCATTGTALYYGNGVNTAYDRAQEIADDDLPGLADEASVTDVVELGVAYNHTDGLLLDVIETLEQKVAEDPRFGWFLLNNATSYLLRGLNVLGIVNLPAGGAALVATLQGIINQGIADSATQLGTFYDADVADQVLAYDEDLRMRGYRVVVVAHSQGNLYANAARAALTPGAAAFLGSFGIVAVADPAEITFNGYVTSDSDLVINTLRKLGRTVLPANVQVPVTAGDFLGHGFEEIYVNAQLPARARVVSLFSNVSRALLYPTTGTIECGTPTQCRFGFSSASAAVSGSVPHGSQQLYTLRADAGQGLMFRVAEVGSSAFYPSFSVYNQTGARVVNNARGSDVASAFLEAAVSGTYTVAVDDDSSSPAVVGTYNLFVVVAPGTDACGTLSPGVTVAAELGKGALDSYTFTAQAGQGFMLRVTDVDAGALWPSFTVYDPTGMRIVNNARGTNVASAFLEAAMSGTYTVVVYDDSTGFDATGGYDIHFILAPGANEFGALSPGSTVAGSLGKGALDSYTFTAQAGQGFMLRVTDVDAGAGALWPSFTVYDPTGMRIVNNARGTNVASAFLEAAMSGTYTVVVYDDSTGFDATGGYDIHFILAPGANEFGALSPGSTVAGSLGKGALDSYTFTAQAGQGFMLRVTDVDAGALWPSFTVYDPTGTRIVNNARGTNVASAFLEAAMSGTYTVVVYDDSTGFDATGGYDIHFILAPGANEFGALSPGSTVAGSLAEGALDSYTFTAQAGQGFMLRVTDVDAGALWPSFTVYDPTGTRVVNNANGADVASASLEAAMSGTYTVVVYDYSSGLASTGRYTLALAITSTSP